MVNLIAIECCRSSRPRIGIFGRMEGKAISVKEDMYYKIEKAAFTLCGNEGDNTLTWSQVEMCEVKFPIIHFFNLLSKKACMLLLGKVSQVLVHETTKSE